MMHGILRLVILHEFLLLFYSPCRGAGEDGQLGIGDVAPTATLRLVSRLTSASAESQVVSLVGGSRNSLALTHAGGVRGHGRNRQGEDSSASEYF